MKNICIITGSDLRMVMGVNYYIKSFLQCNKYFKGVSLNRVYSSVQTLKVDEGDDIPIGSDIGTTEYKIRRGVRTFLRTLLTSRFYPFALFRSLINTSIVSNKAVSVFLKDEAPCDYVIFQELGVAYYYFKKSIDTLKSHPIKTVLINHSEDDSGKSILVNFKGFGFYDMQRRFIKRRDFVYNHIDVVIYISRKAYKNSILPIEKRAYVYNGSPIIDYSFANKETGSLMQFVCVGSITGNKGQDKIIEALDLMDRNFLDNIHLTFVGGGSKYEETRELVVKKNLDKYVTFLGVRNDVEVILKSMDVFIMPSKTEGLPMSAIEAMRAGLYLILTDTGGCAELCEDGCGIVCTRDPKNISEKIYQVFNDHLVNKQQKMHSHKRFVESFSIRSMAEGYEKVLECC